MKKIKEGGNRKEEAKREWKEETRTNREGKITNEMEKIEKNSDGKMKEKKTTRGRGRKKKQ